MFRNLTPHQISIALPDGRRTTIPPSGSVARVVSAPSAPAGDVYGIPLYSAPSEGAIDGLPAAHPSVRGRRDVVAPGTGPMDGAIRNAAGQIEAVTRFIAAPGVGETP